MTERPMIVDVVVKVKVADFEPRSFHSESRLEDEAVAAVADCVSKEKSVEFVAASVLAYEHCAWVRELGQPTDCGLPHPVCLHPDGSWSYHSRGEGEGSGQDFASLVAFVWTQLSALGIAKLGLKQATTAISEQGVRGSLSGPDG